MSLANPYFLIWWMSVGFSLALRAISFGLVGLIIFIIVHELCDFGWLGFVSYTSSKTVEIWEKSQNILSMVSAGIFLIFGIYFLYSGLTSILAG